jgi:DNA-binding NarL/FixJ family response regulator
VIRLLLVDDQHLVRAGLRMLCESTDDIAVVGEARDGAEAVRSARELVPDVILMDLRMPGVDGTTATRRIVDERPSAKVVVLTTFDDDDHLYPALAAGASGFLAKDLAPERLIAAIRQAADGEPPFSPDVLRRLVGEAVRSRAMPPAAVAAPTDLTDRERDVLELLAEGESNADIAHRLNVGITTVKTHVANIMTKTGSRNRILLAVNAREYLGA